MNGGNLKQGDVLSQLDSMVRHHNTPNVSNPIYVIHLPPNTTMSTSNGGSMCNDPGGNNGWNETFNALYGGFWTDYYIILPDPSTCGAGSAWNVLGYDGLTRALSHEIVENATDPKDPKNGWRDDAQPSSCNGKQVADLCNNIETAITTPYGSANGTLGSAYNVVVQKLWSNKLNACVTEDVVGQPLR
jgi:hypothetical protein